MLDIETDMGRGEFVKAFFAKGRRIDIWESLLAYTIEPPETIRTREVIDDLRGDGAKLAHVEVWYEFGLLQRAGMLERTSPRTYRRLEHPMWTAVEANVAAVNEIYPTS
jgi:hypothetical protein